MFQCTRSNPIKSINTTANARRRGFFDISKDLINKGRASSNPSSEMYKLTRRSREVDTNISEVRNPLSLSATCSRIASDSPGHGDGFCKSKMANRKSESTLAFVARGLAIVSVASSANLLASSKAKESGGQIDIKACVVASDNEWDFLNRVPEFNVWEEHFQSPGSITTPVRTVRLSKIPSAANAPRANASMTASSFSPSFCF